jgi:hypothetical protein
MHMRLKQNKKAKADVLWLLEKDSPQFDKKRLMQLYQRL